MAEDTGLASANVSAGDDGLATQYNNVRTDIKILRQLTLTAGATIDGTPTPKPVYLKDSDNQVYQCDGNDIATVKFIGFAITDSTSGNPVIVQHHGICGGFSSLDIGKYYYVDDSGALATTAGTYRVLVGLAVSATEILIMREPITIRAHGVFTRAGNAASGNEVVAHGMAIAPTRVEVMAFAANSQFAAGSSGMWFSGGTYSNTNWNDINAAGNASTDTSNIIYLRGLNTSSGDTQNATLTVDATNLTFAFVKTGSPANISMACRWYAEVTI